jgi:CDP-diacylglycerol--serine O-phosphatidyltransferase
MTQQRKNSGLDTEPVVDEAKVHALRQYNDTDGHFSLVRFVDDVHETLIQTRSGSFANESWFEQEFPSRRPRNDHEWRLWCILHLLFGQVSRDKDPNYLWTALWLPLAGCMFDLFDGKIARWRKASSMLGQELDSLADLVRIHPRDVILHSPLAF